MATVSSSPRRQRRALYDASTFERRRRMTVLLSRDLRRRFGRRSVPVRKGDTVRVLSGSFVGREERVAEVDRRSYSVTLDNVTLKTTEEKLKPLPMRPTHLVLTRLNLADPWRRRTLRLREEDVTPEERGVVGEEEGAAGPAAEAPAAEADAPPEPVPEATETPARAAPSRRRSSSPPPSESEEEA